MHLANLYVLTSINKRLRKMGGGGGASYNRGRLINDILRYILFKCFCKNTITASVQTQLTVCLSIGSCKVLGAAMPTASTTGNT